MNCQLVGITFTARDGRQSQLEAVYIRGSQIRLGGAAAAVVDLARFFVLPDMLKNAPMFRKAKGAAGRGKVAILRAQGMIILAENVP